jgi:hypothetical protein
MNFVRYIKQRRIFRIGYLISGCIMLLLAFLTYYGQNSGNFVMSVDEDAFKRGIAISDSSTFETMNRWLTADPVEDVRDTTLQHIDLFEIINAEGAYKETRSNYLAYTFFLRNVGSETTPVDYEVVITNQSKNIAEAIRVMIIVDGQVAYDEQGIRYIECESKTMYQAPDKHDIVYKDYLQDFTLFKSTDIICSERIFDIRPEQTKKISVVMWLEGEDPECIETLASAKIKITMNLSIPKYAEEE